MRKVTNRWFYKQRNGTQMGVSEVQEYAETTNFDSPGREFIPAMKSYVADNGYHLNALAAGAFEVVETGEVVTLSQ